VNADLALPVVAEVAAYKDKGDHNGELRFPELWSEEFAHYLGWLIGDGSTSGSNTVTVYGSVDDRVEVLPRHEELLAWINGGRPLKLSEQSNGTAQLRLSRRPFKRFLEALGVKSATGAHKEVPWSVEQAPTFAAAAFLRGLFDADGCAVLNRDKGSYVGLGSISIELLRGAQRLLSTFGISSHIYVAHDGTKGGGFTYTRVDGTDVAYTNRAPSYDLRITAGSLDRFAAEVGFSLSAKQQLLAEILSTRARKVYNVDTTTTLETRTEEGVELTYNLSEPRNHSYVANGVVVRNCSEYMHIDNSACNLASINLLKYLDDDDSFEVAAFKHTVEVMFTAQEILVGRADYPTEAIAENSRKFRQLGLGYANLGALLMALGLPYDSNEGRALAGAITSLMTGHAYATSAKTAGRMGPFSGFAENEEHMLRVLRMHRAEAANIDEDLVPSDLLSAAQQAWDEAVAGGEEFGVRNSQSSVLAPTGTIGLMMDCDTTGIEPDLGLVKSKKLVGGGNMSIVNQTVPRALRRLGHTTAEIDDIVRYIDENKSIVGAPHLKASNLPVFACSMGDNVIHYLGHVKMMSAVQPFISGAISKTVNMPEEATVEEVELLHMESWKLGLKAVAIYRDNCKVGQPLSANKKDTEAGMKAARDEAEALAAAPTAAVAVTERIIERIVHKPIREKLPRTRRSKTFQFRVADCKGFVTVGEYDDGRPGELFMRVSKQGSTLAGIMDAFAISVSHCLQYGVPVRVLVEQFTNMRFEPAGITDDPDIRFASSLMDYLFRRLALEYLTYEERAELNILSIDERLEPTLPGIEESVVVTRQGQDIASDSPSIPSASDLAAELEAGFAPAAPLEPKLISRKTTDAPMCMTCGVQMVRAGSCHACPSCGNTSGCS
jgi:ribonucleoside-diphosphate reductase alpha chain